MSPQIVGQSKVIPSLYLLGVSIHQEQSYFLSSPFTSTSPMRPNSNYRPDIEGLHVIAVSAVVLQYVFAPLIIRGMISVPKDNKFFVDLCTKN